MRLHQAGEVISYLADFHAELADVYAELSGRVLSDRSRMPHRRCDHSRADSEKHRLACDANMLMDF